MIALIFHSQTGFREKGGGIPLAPPSLTRWSGACKAKWMLEQHAVYVYKHQLNRAATETDGFGYTFWPQQFFITIIKDQENWEIFHEKAAAISFSFNQKRNVGWKLYCVYSWLFMSIHWPQSHLSVRAPVDLGKAARKAGRKSFAKSSRLPMRIHEWKHVRNELTSGARIKAKVSDTCTQRSDVSQQVKDCLRYNMFTIWVENQNLGLKWAAGRYNFKLARSFCPFVIYKKSPWLRSIILIVYFISSTFSVSFFVHLNHFFRNESLSKMHEKRTKNGKINWNWQQM